MVQPGCKVLTQANVLLTPCLILTSLPGKDLPSSPAIHLADFLLFLPLIWVAFLDSDIFLDLSKEKCGIRNLLTWGGWSL